MAAGRGPQGRLPANMSDVPLFTPDGEGLHGGAWADPPRRQEEARA